MNPIARLIGKLLSWRHRHFVAGGNRFRERRLQFFIEALVEREREYLMLGMAMGSLKISCSGLVLGTGSSLLTLCPVM